MVQKFRFFRKCSMLSKSTSLCTFFLSRSMSEYFIVILKRDETVEKSIFANLNKEIPILAVYIHMPPYLVLITSFTIQNF